MRVFVIVFVQEDDDDEEEDDDDDENKPFDPAIPFILAASPISPIGVNIPVSHNNFKSDIGISYPANFFIICLKLNTFTVFGATKINSHDSDSVILTHFWG